MEVTVKLVHVASKIAQFRYKSCLCCIVRLLDYNGTLSTASAEPSITS